MPSKANPIPAMPSLAMPSPVILSLRIFIENYNQYPRDFIFIAGYEFRLARRVV